MRNPRLLLLLALALAATPAVRPSALPRGGFNIGPRGRIDAHLRVPNDPALADALLLTRTAVLAPGTGAPELTGASALRIR